MLIIPAETAINWKRPPWVTLGLMLVCLLVFSFYQAKDSRLLQQGVDQYLESDLLELEAQAYVDYLERQIRIEGEEDLLDHLSYFEELRAMGAREAMAINLLIDRDFYFYLQENLNVIWSTVDRQRWQEQRPSLQAETISQLSSVEAGVIPAELSIHSLISYQFLHGGWGHLIGNMVFLFLLGFAIERALGTTRYLIAYLICGALSGLFYSLVSLKSHMPLVGASGSISGLMGMYAAIYGTRTIRFFLFLGVYFNYFKAPALVLLVAWLGKEVFDYFYAGATGIAYMAHAGGLLAGAGMIWLLGQSWLQVREEFEQPEEAEQDQRFTSSYAQALASVGRMDFDLARQQFEALRKHYPDRTILLEHLYRLAKLRPDLPEYRDRTRELMSELLTRKQTDEVLEIWQEYQRRGESHAPLAAEDHSRVLFACLRQDNLKLAEKVFERLRSTAKPTEADDGKSASIAEEACRLLADEFKKRQMAPKARHYAQLLANGL